MLGRSTEVDLSMHGDSVKPMGIVLYKANSVEEPRLANALTYVFASLETWVTLHFSNLDCSRLTSSKYAAIFVSRAV